jgi:hypothetical protein
MRLTVASGAATNGAAAVLAFLRLRGPAATDDDAPMEASTSS